MNTTHTRKVVMLGHICAWLGIESNRTRSSDYRRWHWEPVLWWGSYIACSILQSNTCTVATGLLRNWSTSNLPLTVVSVCIKLNNHVDLIMWYQYIKFGLLVTVNIWIAATPSPDDNIVWNICHRFWWWNLIPEMWTTRNSLCRTNFTWNSRKCTEH